VVYPWDDINNPGPNSGFNVSAVLDLARSLSSHSWECGTASEALLELFDPVLAVYTFPIPTIAPKNSPALTYAQEKIIVGASESLIGLSDGDGAVRALETWECGFVGEIGSYICAGSNGGGRVPSGTSTQVE